MTAPVPIGSIEIPGAGEGQAPLSGTQFVTQQQLSAAPNNQLIVPLTGAQFISVYNRTAHTVWVDVTFGAITPFSVLMEPGTAKHMTLPSNVVAGFLTVTDLVLNRHWVRPLAREGKLIGRRFGSMWPYSATAFAVEEQASLSGCIVITSTTIPALIQESQAMPMPPINGANAFFAAGAGSITLTSANIVAGGAPTALAAGYFMGFHVFNASTNAGNLSVAPKTPEGVDITGGAPYTFPPGSQLYVPIECDTIAITATAANQFLIAYQPVLWNPPS